MESTNQHCMILLVLVLILTCNVIIASSSSPATKRFHFNVEWKQVTRLCHTKSLLTVNGEYPGPTIAVHEGDRVEVEVTNRIAKNTTIHWHGIRQLRTAWADGPAYITQCPIRGGHTYTYKFNVVDQRGTLLWHAHFSWQRASVHGAFIIYPRVPYPFSPKIQAEIPIIFGEWWNGDVDAVESEMMLLGGGPNSSDAYTINGLPGPLYPCSAKDTFVQAVEPGKTYMLRIINAAISNELFFAVANHTLRVVEVDAVYTKPFLTPAIMIAPGQTTNVLITANQAPDPSGMFPMAATPYLTSSFPADNTTTVGFLQYKGRKSGNKNTKPSVVVPNLPKMTDTPFATKFLGKLRSLATPQYPCRVPKAIDKRVITTISLNLQDCPPNRTCKGYAGKRFYASMNNQSFVRPLMSILEGHYKSFTSSQMLASRFPEQPPKAFNFTGVDPVAENMNTEFGNKLLAVPFGTNLEIVLQDTSFLNPENHPIHVHGHNFFIVGQGFGNYDAKVDPMGYNLVDPPERNTVAVPIGGWSAIRFKADNPGAWFIHCHLEQHTSWGLAMAFVVPNGPGATQSLLPPPDDLPSC
ncbi:laccase-1 [Rhodamnia argentea]|uniref:Laccase n=1 Tax=Rhodamnia argentea TaxID=178133 RepID=A0ABM3HIC4_9MYRT|nr:laccase-1 [Rhodamnia argentea]